ncbi:MAG: CTP synthase [Actinomycetia bacterium]|nr:CTP synthase [Actinomycetes bacterium]
MAKHIFITGGVISSLGKGITSASLGRLLKSRGYKVTMQKADPYLNVDPSMMSPFQHGEVFVTDDGHEGDLDLGHYERFTDVSLTRESNFTAGRIYQDLLEHDRNGDFSGGTVQVIPHMTNAIRDRFTRIAEPDTDIVITEIGGTVGDIESLPFIEAARQFKMSQPLGDVIFIHVTLLPYVAAENELKTKPTQHSVKELRSIGVQPDFIVCRSDHPLDDQVRDKIALFCDVRAENVISCPDADNIYQVPLILHEQDFDARVLAAMGLPVNPIDLVAWQDYVRRQSQLEREVNIALVGQYVSLPDSYLSIVAALQHAGVAAGCKVNLHLVDVDTVLEQGVESTLAGMDGILVPGGYGYQVMEGKIAACAYAREHNIPFLGICLGMQAAVLDFARQLAGLPTAESSEYEAEDHPVPVAVVDRIPALSAAEMAGRATSLADQQGPRRIGAYPLEIMPGTRAFAAYGQSAVSERYAHRYALNNAYRDQLVAAGLVISGQSPDGRFVDIVELPDHPWYVACQGHPEFKSRPTRPHPLYVDFVRAAAAQAH